MGGRVLVFILILTFSICSNAWGDVAKIEGTTNVEDTWLFVYSPDNAYGGLTEFKIRVVNSYTRHALIRAKDVATALGVGATNITAVCSLYCSVNTVDGSVSAYRVFKPWVEGDDQSEDNDDGDATWNDWASDASEWTTAGCDNADDGGEDNSGDGTGADRKATAEGNAVSVTQTGWYSWTISTELATAWYNETAEENGIVLIDASGNNEYYSTEYTTDPSKCPFFVFTYTSGEPPEAAPLMRRRNIIKDLGQGGMFNEENRLVCSSIFDPFGKPQLGIWDCK